MNRSISLLFWLLSSLIVQAQDLSHLPLLNLEDRHYLGAFRLPAQEFGISRLSYSQGPIAYNPDHHSLFIVGHAHQQAIAEFAVPELVLSDSLADLNFSGPPIQGFRQFLESAPDGNPEGIDRVGGLYYVAGPTPQLVVNAYEYYDAPGDNTVSALVVEEANDLASSPTRGYLRFQGGAGHTSGWLSPIPKDLQNALGGTHLTGQSSGWPIISRLSVGPSAFSFYLSDLLQADDEVTTTKLLDFSLRDRLHPDLRNDSLQNDVWTHLSRATYGFIVPGTRSYLTLGKSGGHASGVCYKCEQDNGNRCGGYCSPMAADNSQYYWLWDLQDLVDVKNGVREAHSVRPYEYGEFATPFTEVYHGIGGGSFDPITGTLYLTIQKGDTDQGRYARPPVVVAYSFPDLLNSDYTVEQPAPRVYPNPTTGGVTITQLAVGTEVTLVNGLGAVLGSSRSSGGPLRLDLSGFPRGLYVARLANPALGYYWSVKVVRR